MRRALGCVCFWLAVYLLSSCAGRLQKSHDRQKNEETTTKWAASAEKHEKQQQQTARDEQRKVTGKLRVTKPDGTTWDLDWVDEAVAKYTARAESGSVSLSTAGGEAEKKLKEHDRGQVDAGVKTSLPWFRIGAGVVSAAVVCYLVWRWRRRRSLLGL